MKILAISMLKSNLSKFVYEPANRGCNIYWRHSHGAHHTGVKRRATLVTGQTAHQIQNRTVCVQMPTWYRASLSE